VVAVNKPLLEAYNAMWSAGTELEIGEPVARFRTCVGLAAIQKARQAERLYLARSAPQVVIDISKSRLKGKDKGRVEARRALTSSIRRVTRASVVSPRSSSWRRAIRARRSTRCLLRIDALGDEPAFAAALSDAASAMRRGKSGEASTALTRARRALAGSPIVRDSLARWGIVP
jgi:hypothetical protein